MADPALQRCACGHSKQSHFHGNKLPCSVDNGVGCGCPEFRDPTPFEAGVVYNLERLAKAFEASGDQNMRDRLESTLRLRGR